MVALIILGLLTWLFAARRIAATVLSLAGMQRGRVMAGFGTNKS